MPQRKAEAVARFFFHTRGGQGFMLDDEGSGAGLGNEDIGATAASVGCA